MRVPERERERRILSAPGLGGGRLRPAMTVRDFWLFGEVMYMENQAVTWYHSGCVQRDFIKGELKCVGQGPCVQLLYQQNEKIESKVCSH